MNLEFAYTVWSALHGVKLSLLQAVWEGQGRILPLVIWGLLFLDPWLNNLSEPIFILQSNWASWLHISDMNNFVRGLLTKNYLPTILEDDASLYPPLCVFGCFNLNLKNFLKGHIIFFVPKFLIPFANVASVRVRWRERAESSLA